MQPKKTYRIMIERKGHTLDFFVDGQKHLSYFDPSPLGGKGFNRFAFNDWEAEVHFDNLRITAL